MKNFKLKLQPELTKKIQTLYTIEKYSDIVPELYRQLDIIIISLLSIERFNIDTLRYDVIGCNIVNNLELSTLMRAVPGLQYELKLNNRKCNVFRLKKVFIKYGIPNASKLTVKHYDYNLQTISLIVQHKALAIKLSCTNEDLTSNVRIDLLNNLGVICDNSSKH